MRAKTHLRALVLVNYDPTVLVVWFSESLPEHWSAKKYADLHATKLQHLQMYLIFDGDDLVDYATELFIMFIYYYTLCLLNVSQMCVF